MNAPSEYIKPVVTQIKNRLREAFDLEGMGETVILSAIVGAVAGLGAFLFAYGLSWCSKHIQVDLMRYQPPAAGSEQNYWGYQLDIVTWAVLLFPALGGLLSGFLVFTYCPEAEGHGSDAMVRSFHRLGGAVRGRVPIIKGIASIITICTGGSAGREGPIAQVGAGMGSIIANFLHLNNDQRRFLMLAGAAGGIAAVFQAPLGAALFVCEVLYASAALESAAIVYTTISAVIAYAVYAALHFWTHPAAESGHHLENGVREVIVEKALTFHGLSEIPFYVGFAIICAIAGYFYVKTFYGLRDNFFHKLPLPKMLKPALGGLMLSIMILCVRIPGAFDTGIPHVMGGDYGWIQLVLNGKWITGDGVNVWWILAILAFAKIIATSLTISSGGSGGVFAPSLFVGAMLGGAYGLLCHSFFPEWVPQPEVFAMVGMGGFFAGVAKVPLTAIVMVSEITHSFELLVPLMLVSVLTNTLLSRRITLYEEQVRAPVDSPVHQGDFLVDVLANLRVEQVWDKSRVPTLVREDMPLPQVLHMVDEADANYFPVVDIDGKLTGIFAFSDLKAVLRDHASDAIVIAADIASYPVITVTPQDDLHTALRRVSLKNIEEIPIVAKDDDTKVIGMLRRKDLIAAYNREVGRLQGDSKPKK